jgi:hypothetical protein
LALHGGSTALYSSLYQMPHIQETTYEVAVTTLSRYVHERGLPRVDFIKCDIEGSEFDAFRGAEEFLLASATPPVLQLEMNPPTARAAGYDNADFLHWLQTTFGYQFYHITLTGKLAPYPSVREAADQLADIIACIPAAHAARLARALR